MIFVTGDTHGGDGYNGKSDMSKLNTREFPVQKELTKRDYLIICGDCGIVFYGNKRDKYWIDWLEQKNFTTLFVDGNHENFDLLEQYEEVEMFGSTVHKISDSVYHLMRGRVYHIDGLKVFTMGGALSSDRRYLRNGEQSWWDREIPSNEEFNRGFDELDKVGNEVDLIITHEAPDKVIDNTMSYISHNIVSNYLESIRDRVRFKLWCFGHHHKDMLINSRLEQVEITVSQRSREQMVNIEHLKEHFAGLYNTIIRVK